MVALRWVRWYWRRGRARRGGRPLDALRSRVPTVTSSTCHHRTKFSCGGGSGPDVRLAGGLGDRDVIEPRCRASTSLVPDGLPAARRRGSGPRRRLLGPYPSLPLKSKKSVRKRRRARDRCQVDPAASTARYPGEVRARAVAVDDGGAARAAGQVAARGRVIKSPGSWGGPTVGVVERDRPAGRLEGGSSSLGRCPSVVAT